MTVPTRTKRLGEYRQSTDGYESPDFFGWLSGHWFGHSLMRMGVFSLLTCISVAGCFDDFESSDVSRAAFKCAGDNDCRDGLRCFDGVCSTAPEPVSPGGFCDELEVFINLANETSDPTIWEGFCSGGISPDQVSESCREEYENARLMCSECDQDCEGHGSEWYDRDSLV